MTLQAMARWLVTLVAVLSLVLPTAWVQQALYFCPGDLTLSTVSCCDDGSGKGDPDHCCGVVQAPADREVPASLAPSADVAVLPVVDVGVPPLPDVAATPADAPPREPRGPPPDGPPTWLKHRSLLI